MKQEIQKIRRHLRAINLQINNKGSVLLIGYFVVIIFLGIGAALLALSVNEKRVTDRERLEMMAFHIAEAGIERALYDLRLDFITDPTSPNWADGDINGYAIGPDSANYYTIPYSSTTLNGGSYTAQLKNVSGDDIWVRSTGTINDVSHTLLVYVRIIDISPWNNAIFAGGGASGMMVNGNVNIRGSVHILGSGLNDGDLAIDLGGTAELVGNNYNGLSSSLKGKVPALSTTVHNGETVETLNAELRVKKGLVGLSGSSTVGEANATGNSAKETVDGAFVTDGYSGNMGAASVYSDNGTSNAYDLGNAIGFPSLSDPAPSDSSITYQQYLYNNALVINDAAKLTQLASIDPGSSFTYTDPGGKGSISMDGSGNMTVNGIVYVDGGGLNMLKTGSDKTITYTGSGSLLVTGDVQINVNLVTSGDNSFPNNIMGVMTPGSIGFNEASIDVMGLFYAENSVVVQKQTDIMGTIVSNYFDMGTNVPAIFQVPDVINHLPPGMIGGNSKWYMVVSWQKI